MHPSFFTLFKGRVKSTVYSNLGENTRSELLLTVNIYKFNSKKKAKRFRKKMIYIKSWLFCAYM